MGLRLGLAWGLGLGFTVLGVVDLGVRWIQGFGGFGSREFVGFGAYEGLGFGV